MSSTFYGRRFCTHTSFKSLAEGFRRPGLTTKPPVQNRKLILLPLFFCFLFTAFSAKADTQLPESLRGYYLDQDNRLVVLQQDFFYLEDFLSKSGYFQEVQQTQDGEWTTYIRQFAGQTRLLSLVLRTKGNGVEAILKDYTEKQLTLRPIQPQSAEATLPFSEGTWYCGEEDLVVEVSPQQIKLEEEVFEVESAFQVINDQKLKKYFLLKSDQHQQFLPAPILLNENYFGWNLLDRLYEHCRKDRVWPYNESDFYEDLPVDLIGNWESSDNEKVNISFYPDYFFSRSKEKVKIHRISNLPTTNTMHFEAEIGDDHLLWEIEPLSENELKITDISTKKSRTYLRTSEIADFVDIPEEEVEKVPVVAFAIGIALGLIIAIIAIVRTRRRSAKRKKDFV